MELEFIRWLREHVPSSSRAPLGLCDDAAVLSLAKRSDIVVTTDLLSDGVDFRLESDDPRRIGRKALAVNLSDLAAMAARPHSTLVSIALPRNPPGDVNPLELAIALYEGMLPLAEEFDIALAGGDTNTHDGPLVISVTAIGQVSKERGPLTRHGGQPDDSLFVTGALGGSILGHHFDFTPRVREALFLHENYELHAGMDISDGLALDLARLAAENNCGAELCTERIPISPAARELAEAETPTPSGRFEVALQHALSDGEDFELLLAVPPDAAAAILRDRPLRCPITHIGTLTADQGLWLQTTDNQRRPLEPAGWTH